MNIDKKKDIYNVTRLNREVRAVLEGSFPEIQVQGELSNLAQPGSGHIYFSLKDRSSQVRCAMFKGRNRHLTFEPDNGMEVIIRANVSLYEGRGEFQLIVEAMEPAGEGALQKAFEALKSKLHGEGLFDEAHKSPLPEMPRLIGVITSPTGAAIRDILHVLNRRYPLAKVMIYPVPVQGEGASGEIKKMLEKADQKGDCDVFILARGGGSLEDLWAFNDEDLARTIHALQTPLVSGVGHEIDFTIADFVADHRAPTPSAAAEMVTPDKSEITNALSAQSAQIIKCIQYELTGRLQHVRQLEKRLPHPARQLQHISQRLDDLFMHLQKDMHILFGQIQSKLTHTSGMIHKHSPMQRLFLYTQKNTFLAEQMDKAINKHIRDLSHKLAQLAHSLDLTSPLATLDRGYAIITDEQDTVIRDAAVVDRGDTILSRVSSGRIKSTVIDKVIDIEKE